MPEIVTVDTSVEWIARQSPAARLRRRIKSRLRYVKTGAIIWAGLIIGLLIGGVIIWVWF